MITFQTFPSLEEAEAVASQLQRTNINTQIVKATPLIDTVIAGQQYSDEFELKISAEDFVRANELLYDKAIAETDIADHPLQEMSDDELKDIIAKPDEWGPENYNIALVLLNQRNIIISETSKTDMQNARIATLSERKPADTYLIFLGYLTSVVPFIINAIKEQPGNGGFIWYFPGFIGVIIGLVITQASKTLPNGKKMPVYTQSSQKHGIAILLLNITSWIVNAILLMFFFA